MQTRNLVLFCILSLGILVGWTYLSSRLWPVKPKVDDQSNSAKLDKKHLGPVTIAQTVARAGEGPWASLVTDLTEVGRRYPVPKPPRWYDCPPLFPPALAIIPLSSHGDFLGFLALLPRQSSSPQEPLEVVGLGGPGYHLQAKLTSQGAGVQHLVLNQFEGVNWIGRPTNAKLNLIQEDPIYPSFLLYHYPTPEALHPVTTLGQQIWKLQEIKKDSQGNNCEVVFTTMAPAPYHQVRITKTYRLGPRDYHLGLLLEFQVEGEMGEAQPPLLRYQLAGSHGMPIEGEWYTSTFRNAVVGMVDSNNKLWRELKDSAHVAFHSGSEKIPLAERNQTLIQYSGVMTQFFASLIVVDDVQPKKSEGGGDPRKILAWARATQETEEIKGRIGPIQGDRLRFVGDGLDHSYQMLPRVAEHLQATGLGEGSRAVLSYYVLPNGQRVASWIREGQALRPAFDDLTVRVNSEPIELKTNFPVAHQFLLYHGPVKTRLLGQFRGDQSVPAELVDRYTDTLHLNTLTDYASDNWFGRRAQDIGWTWLLIQCTKLMHWLLNLLQMVLPIPGLSIILLTVIVRGAMYPISRRQALFSIRMQALQPEMKKIGEKFKDDPAGKMAAMRELHKKHNINPLASCFPLLLQMPIFLGLYYCLQESVKFRLAPFLWIESLTAPDMLLWWGQGIPLISDPDNVVGGWSFLYLGPFLNLLPIAAVALMIVQQKYLTPPPADEEQAKQQSIMRYVMGFMGIMFYKVSSGLCIYFIASSLWGLAERQLLPKKPDPNKLPPAPVNKSVPGKPGGPKAKSKTPVRDEEVTAIQKMKDWWQKVLREAEKK